MVVALPLSHTHLNEGRLAFKLNYLFKYYTRLFIITCKP